MSIAKGDSMMASTKTYKVSDIAAILQISRTKAYEVVSKNMFPVVHIGKAIRIPIEPFERWMFSQGRQNSPVSEDTL